MDVSTGRADVAGVLFDSICRLYDEVFSGPPFIWTSEESSTHEELLRRIIKDPSFSVVTACEGDELAGFAYGVSLKVDTKWWQGLPDAVEADFYTEFPGRTFALIDLAVRSAHRRRGLGGRLVTDLIKHRPEERATLSVQPTAIEATRFYRHLGWEYIGNKQAEPGSVSPSWDIFVKKLHSSPRAVE